MTLSRGRPGGSREHRKGEAMEIIISNSSDKPIYEQITSQVKALVVTGELTDGERLPSIRALATSLRVSAITTKRAYADLESQGYIVTVPGKGCFVAGGNTELIREEHLRQVEELVNQAVASGRAVGLSNGELREVLELALSEDV